MSYVSLATITLTGSDAEIVFSNIPNSYKDLVIVFDGTGSAGSSQFNYNSDTTMSNYKQVRMYNFNNSVGSDFLDNSFFNLGSLVNKQASIIQIFDYAQTNKQKLALIKQNTPGVAVGSSVTRWPSTAAITSIRLFHEVGTFSSGSTFSLYGIA